MVSKKTGVPRLSTFFKIWFGCLIVTLWSSALFEGGLNFFVERMGITVFRLSGILFLTSSSLFLLGKAKLFGYSFLKNHRLLLLLYAGYWLIAGAGVLYSPVAEFGLFAVVEYCWYTALALLTILILYHFSIEQRKLLFLLIGLFSLLILTWFSRSIVTTGVDPVAREKFSISVFRDYNVFTRSLILSGLLILLGTKDTYSSVPKVKLFSYIALILLVIGMGVLAGSRRSVALYGPIAMFTPSFLLWIRSRRRFIRAVVSATVISTLMVVVLGGNINQEVISGTVYSNLDEAALQRANKRMDRVLRFFTGEARIDSRLWRWEAAWDIAGEYSSSEILVGRGTRSFYNESKLSHTYPHNFLLSALLEGGVLKLLVLVALIVVWMCHVLLTCRGHSFWLANFLLASNVLWLVSVSISGEEFFGGKQFMLLVIVYATFWRSAARKSPRQCPRKAGRELLGEGI